MMKLREINAAECYGILEQARSSQIAGCEDGQPYIAAVYFAFSGSIAYSFTMPGKKLDWMRENEKFCLHVDQRLVGDGWTSIVVEGRFEEFKALPSRPYPDEAPPRLTELDRVFCNRCGIHTSSRQKGAGARFDAFDSELTAKEFYRFVRRPVGFGTKDRMIMLKLITALAVVASAPALAFASPSCTKEPTSKWMPEDAMKAKIDTLGYKVKTFEVTGNCYEIYGKDKDGKRAEVYFNPVSGDIVQKGD